MFMAKNLIIHRFKPSILAILIGLFSPNLTLAQTNLDKLVIELCQKSIEVKVAASEDIRRRVEISFDTIERSLTSNTEQKIQGTARLRTKNNWQPFTYNCLVKRNEGLVTQANYTLEKDGLTSSTRLCQEELKETVRENRNGSVEFDDPLETYYVSNTEEGVRGTFIVQETGNRSQPNRFNCTVNLREGRVTKLTYSPDGSDRSTASEQRIIRLCQENIRQQVSQNQIDLGGIFGISIGTGRKIEFGQAVDTFDISESQKGVEGNATLLEGSKQRQVNYRCTVNLPDGTITNATIQ